MRGDKFAIAIVVLVVVFIALAGWLSLRPPTNTRVVVWGMGIEELMYFDPATGEIAKRVGPKEAFPPVEKELVVGLGSTIDHKKVIALFKFEKGALIGREPQESISPSMGYLKGEVREAVLQFLEPPLENTSK